MKRNLLALCIAGALCAPAFAVPEDVGAQPSLDDAISSAAAKMLPGGEYENREDYAVSGIAGHYNVDAEEVRTKLRAAFELAKTPPVSDSSTSDETAKTDTAGHPAGAHLDAPAAGNTDPVDELVIEPGKTVALVSKGNEKLPVQLRDKAHLDELIATHGAGSVEVQP